MKTWFNPVLAGLAVFGLLCIPITVEISKHVQLKPGQVWIFPGRTRDPFYTPGRIETNIVVAVKSGYVQYDNIERAWFSSDMMTNRTSCSVSWFLAGSKRIK